MVNNFSSRRLLFLLSLLALFSGVVAGGFGLIKVSNNKNLETVGEQFAEKMPIVYSSGYNIGLFGIEKIVSPFDTHKAEFIHNYLVEKGLVEKDQFYTPSEITDQQLQQVHGEEYITDLRSRPSEMFARITEQPVIWALPNFLTRLKVETPMRLAAGGTLVATELALERGYAFNLGGGYHHAKCNSGGGFCPYADIPLAALNAFDHSEVKRVLIIDLDAHQGNGHEEVVGRIKDRLGNNEIKIFDVYNAGIYPHDHAAKKHIDFNCPVEPWIQTDDYLRVIKDNLPKTIEKFKPDFIIYNAGTDILDGDRLGCMRVSQEGVIKRDELVFEYAMNRQKMIPIVMLLSGGYTKQSAPTIARSIENLLPKIQQWLHK